MQDQNPPASLAEQSSINNGERSDIVSTTKEEKTSNPPKKMKHWPGDPKKTVPYQELIEPLKKILDKGYAWRRHKHIEEFEYEGYNIGRAERQFIPPPNYAFTKKFLEEQKDKHNRSIIDIVLQMVFVLGIEQGRRAERRDYKAVSALIDTLDKYRKDNRKLRLQLDLLAIETELKDLAPDLTETDFKKMVLEEAKKRKPMRFAKARKELGKDPMKTFRFKNFKPAKFSDLEAMAKAFSKNTCSLEQWVEILAERGWSVKDWNKECKKRKFDGEYSKIEVEG